MFVFYIHVFEISHLICSSKTDFEIILDKTVNDSPVMILACFNNTSYLQTIFQASPFLAYV